MAVPKRKTSKSRRNMRRSHHALKPVAVSYDAETGAPHRPHHIAAEDGHYKGKQVTQAKINA
jgi:large subunit ribosomal protein L32